MGTRSTYRIIEQWKDEKGKTINDEICLVYFQYDGYPEGHPLETADWLSKGNVANGIGLRDERLVFNGAGCLSAQFIAKFKEGAGNVYMYPLKSRGKCCEDYLYDIIVNLDRSIEFVCFDNCGETPYEIFRGTPQEFASKYQSVTQ